MAEIKSGPYEILIRYNCEPGEIFGQIRGCHRVMKSYVVDGEGKITGKIDNGAADLATDFPTSELRQFLGAQFTAFNAQLEAAKAAQAGAEEAQRVTERDLANVAADRDEHMKAVSERDAAIARLNAKVEELAVDLDQHRAALLSVKSEAIAEPQELASV